MTLQLHEQLPVVMATDPRLRRFVAIFEGMAAELYDRVGSTDLLLDATTAPRPMLSWLAGVIDVPIRDVGRIAVQRNILTAAAAEFSTRGTRRSIEAHVFALTGSSAKVNDRGVVTVLTDAEAAPETGAEASGAATTPDDAAEAAPETGAEASGAATTPTDSGSAAKMITLAAWTPVPKDDIIALVERELPVTVGLGADDIDIPLRPPTSEN